MSKTGITICGHGTRSADGLTAFFNVYHSLEHQLVDEGFAVNYGFIEQSEPLLQDALTEHITNGISEMIVLPLLLFAGVHTTHDIPYVVKTVSDHNPGITIKVSEPLGLSQNLVDMCVNTLENAVNEVSFKVNQYELLVVGVGSSNPDANLKIATLTRAIWENLPFNYASYAFVSKMAYPGLDPAFERLKACGAQNVMILPILLFPGVYLNNLVLKAESERKNFSGTTIVCKTLDQNPHLTTAFIEKMHQAMAKEYSEKSEIPTQPRKTSKN